MRAAAAKRVWYLLAGGYLTSREVVFFWTQHCRGTPARSGALAGGCLACEPLRRLLVGRELVFP